MHQGNELDCKTCKAGFSKALQLTRYLLICGLNDSFSSFSGNMKGKMKEFEGEAMKVWSFIYIIYKYILK